MNSKHYKNQSTTAKRTATALLGMAEHCQDAEGKGLLLAASRVASQIARQNHARHQEEVRKEAEYASALKRMAPESEAKIRSDWPMQTTVQKMAIIAAERGAFLLTHVVDRIGYKPESNLQSELEDCITGLARSAAHAAHTKKAPITDALCELARRVEAYYTNSTVLICAKQVDAKLNLEAA